MKMAEDKSTTWSFHIHLICKIYGLPDPLALLQQPTMSKSAWKTLVTNRVTVYHEAQLRSKAMRNLNLEYFKVQLLGLTGRPPAAIISTEFQSLGGKITCQDLPKEDWKAQF